MGPLLITGAGGMLAGDLIEYFDSHPLAGQGPVIALERSSLDISQPREVEKTFEKHRPSVVINAAAYTNVDGAESERTRAFAINVSGPQFLAEACEKYSARLFHFGTDQVFDGRGTRPQSEDDAINPLNYYAETKAQGEMAVLKCPGAVVLRVQWLYGKRKDRFTLLKDKKIFTPFEDQWGAPTWTRDIAKITADLVGAKAEGLFHMAYDDYANWAEVFKFAIASLEYETILRPKKTQDVNLPAQRPLYSVLSNRKLLSFLGRDNMGSWKDALSEFLQSQTST
jgi:dTDP-4-dehydrorhamnose reductase